MTRRIVPLLAFLPLVLAAAGCDDDPAAPATTGRVAVETVTTGASLDVNGFLVSVAGGPGRAIGANASLTVFDVEPGARTVELTDLAPNCAVSGPNPREVTVAAGETVSVRVEVSCEGVGTLEIRSATGGLSLDADGYEVSLNGGEATPLALNATVTLGFVPSGPAVVELRSVAGNCEVVGDNPREILVVVDEVAPTEFTVSCEAAGSIEVTAATTGVAFDIGGYTVSTGATAGEVGYDGTLRLDFLAVGNHVLQLGDLAPNCVVSGANPRSVSVSLDEATPVRFDVLCVAPYLGKIAATTDRGVGDGLYDIVLLNEDGSEAASVTTSRGLYDNPALSPDGTRIAVREWTAYGGSDIVVMNVDGTDRITVSGGLGAHEAAHPAWSPQGTRILFATDASGDWDLYAVDADGSNRTAVLAAPGVQWEGSWSPDGTRILYTTDSGDVWTANADGSGQTNLTHSGAPGVYSYGTPSWSPDGTRIAFARYGDPDRGLFVMDADGSNLTALTDLSAQVYGTSWAPDGTRILFGTPLAGNWEAYVVNADGSGLMDLTNTPASQEFPGSPQGWR